MYTVCDVRLFYVKLQELQAFSLMKELSNGRQKLLEKFEVIDKFRKMDFLIMF